MNFLKSFLILFSVALCTPKFFAQEKLPLIPYPQNVDLIEGNFKIPKSIKYQSDFSKNEVENIDFAFKIFNQTNIVFKKNSSKKSQIVFSVLPPNLEDGIWAKDFYAVIILPNQIQIQSNTDKGRFYAINTLFQLFNFYETKGEIPCMEITDSPKFQWRGMHLDVTRHFFTVDEVKKYIDYLAMYKFNTFHWHLTDDQGWRIEIKKYPKLTEIGAWRNGSMIGKYSDNTFDDKRYGGFYTQEQIKEVVKYAAERHITVVPEIEMPGHAVAAIASYPELGCTGKQIEVEKKWGVFEDVFCPKPETFTFLENVLAEVMPLFPSEYIHIGGDECPKENWKKCAHCQNLIKEKGLKDEHELQSYFIQKIEKFVNAHGKKIIGWDEILEGGLAPNAAVMSWRGTEGGIAAAQQKHYVVMSPGEFCYFDHYQNNPATEPIAFGGYTSAEKVYSFNPVPEKLNDDEKKYILGAQANLWSEYILDFKQVEYMIFPRMMALSEVLWGTNLDFNDFKLRFQKNAETLDKMKVNYNKESINQPLKNPYK